MYRDWETKGSQRNGGEVCKKLRAYKKNKKNVLISIVGFGRPKFGTSSAKKATASKSEPKKCPECGQTVK